MAKESTNLVCLACGRETTGAPGALCGVDGSALVSADEAAAQRGRRDPIIGRVVAGRFPVVGLIGRGACGTVYRAVQLPVGREVALKVMTLSAAHDEQLRTRFLREARVVARLSHPSAVTLFDYGEDHDGLLYMVLEYIRGRTLRDVIVDEAPLAPDRVVALTLQVLGALVEAHGIGLIHRDLKPANIMLTREKTGEERARVLDFGMAKVLELEAQASDEATRTGIVVGTPRYLSPEQALAREVGPQTDVYALGVMLYEMLAGQPPFVAPSTFELLMLHTSAEVPPFDPALEVPPALEALVRNALAKQVEHRFKDASAMLDALVATEVPGTLRASLRPAARPRAVSGELEATRLSAQALQAVAARTAALMPETRIAASVRPGPPPPVDHDALDQGTSAAHGEVRDLSSGIGRIERPGGSRRWLGLALGLLALGTVSAVSFVALRAPVEERAAGVGEGTPVDAPASAVAVQAAGVDAAALSQSEAVDGGGSASGGQSWASDGPAGSGAADNVAADTGAADNVAADNDPADRGGGAADNVAADSGAPDSAPSPDAAPSEPDAAPSEPDEPIAAAAPPGEREVREALAAASRHAFAPDALARGDAAALAIDAYLATLDDPAARGEVLLRRAKLWRRIAQSQLGDARRDALRHAQADYVAAMNHTDRTHNFEHYKTAVELTQELFGDLSPEAVHTACAAEHVADYLHRANYCALLEFRAGEAVFATDSPRGAQLVCQGAARYVAELPGQTEAETGRKRRLKRNYLAICKVRQREAAAHARQPADQPAP